jgi:hypothetical protein
MFIKKLNTEIPLARRGGYLFTRMNKWLKIRGAEAKDCEEYELYEERSFADHNKVDGVNYSF